MTRCKDGDIKQARLDVETAIKRYQVLQRELFRRRMRDEQHEAISQRIRDAKLRVKELAERAGLSTQAVYFCFVGRGKVKQTQEDILEAFNQLTGQSVSFNEFWGEFGRGW